MRNLDFTSWQTLLSTLVGLVVVKAGQGWCRSRWHGDGMGLGAGMGAGGGLPHDDEHET